VCELLVPVITTLYVPEVEELKVQVDVELPLAGRGDGEGVAQATDSPVDGAITVDRATVPGEPPTLVSVTVEDPVDPETKLTGPVADIEKSPVVGPDSKITTKLE
jgi:hypothetical protein